MVELVGPAGAGKTTLSRVLSQRSERIVVGADIELRKVEHAPVFVRNAPLLLPLFLRPCRHSRWFTWDEIKAMVYLKGWHRVFRGQASREGAIVLLDHGPVFRLATLNAFGPDRLRNPAAESWWTDMFKHWAFILDMVIWLDAPDVVLEERINARNQRHTVKGKTEHEVSQFLARYRTSYRQTLSKLTAHGRLKLFRFDTNQTSIEAIVDEVLVAFNLKLSNISDPPTLTSRP